MPAIDLPNGQRLAFSLLGSGGGGGSSGGGGREVLARPHFSCRSHATHVLAFHHPRLLAEHLRSLTDAEGRPMVAVCTYHLRYAC